MEMGGKVTISCPKTSYRAEVEFKLKVRPLPQITPLSSVYNSKYYSYKNVIPNNVQTYFYLC